MKTVATLRRDVTTALNKEAAQRPEANNGGRRNENRHRISVGLADWLCNAKLCAGLLKKFNQFDSEFKTEQATADFVKSLRPV